MMDRGYPSWGDKLDSLEAFELLDMIRHSREGGGILLDRSGVSIPWTLLLLT